MEKVYLLKSNVKEHIVYKIGRTKRDVQKRIKELSTGNPGKITIEYVIETKNSSKLESALHGHFSHCRINNEWFNSDLDVNVYIALANRLNYLFG